MHLKTFHAPSIQDAIRQARRELGADAMLLNSRRVTEPNEKNSVFAVTFATAHAPGSPTQDGASNHSGPTVQPNGASQQPRHRGASDRGSHSAETASLGGRTDDRTGQAAQAYRTHSLDPASTTQPAAVQSGPTSGAGQLAAKQTQPKVESASVATTHNADSNVHVKEQRSRQPREDVAGTDEVITGMPSYEKLFEQMTSMRREMLLLAGSVRRASAVNYRQDLPTEELRWVHDVLLSQDFYPETIEEVIEQIAPRLAPTAPTAATGKSRKRSAPRKEPSPSSASLLQVLRESLGARIELAPEPSIRRKTGSPHLVALVGPPGVGKTTTLVKLAARYGANSRFPLQIISMDNYRVAASEQLRTYASVLGVGFDALTSAAALEKTLRQYQAKELILIDTPGYGWRDFAAAEDLAALLRQSESSTIHLVVSASMKPSDLARVADLYELFGYQSILFTKVDETATIGPLISESCLRRKPLSYLCAGQRIPEDIEVATRERILDRVLPAALSSEEFAA